MLTLIRDDVQVKSYNEKGGFYFCQFIGYILKYVDKAGENSVY